MNEHKESGGVREEFLASRRKTLWAVSIALGTLIAAARECIRIDDGAAGWGLAWQ